MTLQSDSELRDALRKLEYKFVSVSSGEKFNINGFLSDETLDKIEAVLATRDIAREKEIRLDELTYALKDNPSSGLYASYYEKRVAYIQAQPSNETKEVDNG